MLYEIAETARNYMNFLAELIKADIEIVDANGRKLCGVGVCALADSLICEGTIYGAVFETGRHVFIDKPRENDVCAHCSQNRRCLDQLEVALPITVRDGSVIGAVGLVAANRAGRDQIISNARAYMFMLESVCGFLAEKAEDAAEIRRLTADLALFGDGGSARATIRKFADLENEEIRRALYVFGEGTAGKKKAAEALGIGVATLYRKLS